MPVKLAEYVAKCIHDYANKNFNLRDVGFVDWLKQEKAYTPRAASDVLSRVRRMKRIAKQHYSQEITDEALLDSIKNTDFFDKLTTSVKSQLRRAQKLYHEYAIATRE